MASRNAPLCSANEYLSRSSVDSQFDAPFSDASSKERCWLIGSSVFSCEAVTLWTFCLVCFAFFFWRLRSSKISPISSSCLVIFVMRGAVTCCELLYSALAVFNGLDMPRPPCRGGRSSIARSLSPGGLRPVRLGIRCVVGSPPVAAVSHRCCPWSETEMSICWPSHVSMRHKQHGAVS